ncbi:MAG: NYN domain-containing protein [Anaerolineaceae bacterium]|nr:NYN domain-containing protein [Anaerolineaceae bacterium]
MAYLIDGHNLIPKMDIGLGDPDDEEKLLKWLEEFSRVRQRKVEVFFDGAPAGFANTRKRGRVLAHFIRQGKIADDAILSRLRKLGKDAQNWTVVSSDSRVQSEARNMHAKVISSEEFADLLAQNALPTPRRRETETSTENIEEWLRLFGGSNQKNS